MGDPSTDWTQNDDKVVYTDNGLRPADAALPQPPQDPDVVLDSRGFEVRG